MAPIQTKENCSPQTYIKPVFVFSSWFCGACVSQLPRCLQLLTSCWTCLLYLKSMGKMLFWAAGGNLDLQSWVLLCLFLWRSEGITCSDCTTGVKIKHILESIIRLKSDIWYVKRADWFPSNLYAQLVTMKWWKNIFSCLGTAWNVTYGCNLSNQMFWLLHYKTF